MKIGNFISISILCEMKIICDYIYITYKNLEI